MKKRVVILGAGISGLAVALKLAQSGHDVEILEKTDKVGGMSGSFKKDDMILDYGPHKLYSQLPGIMAKFKEILQDDCLTVKKFNSINLSNQYFAFPLKLSQLLKRIPLLGFKCGLGYGFGVAKGFIKKKKVISYEDYFLAKFGRPMYELLFKDYAQKVWGDPKKLTEELARKRIPVSSLIDVIKNILFPSKDVSAEFFYYPKWGIGQLCDIIKQKIEDNGGKILFECVPDKIKIQKDKSLIISYKTGKTTKTINADYLISTIPVQELPLLLDPLPEPNIIDSAKELKARSLIILYLVANKEKILKKDNWIFFPQKDYIFNRISDIKSFSPHLMEKNKSVLMVEITCTDNDTLWNSTEKELFDLAIKDLEKGKIIKREEVTSFFTKKASQVYPVYSLDYKQNLNQILDYLDTIPNFLTIGRYGLFNYNNMDHCLDMSFTAAEHVIKEGTPSDWKRAREKFESYRIVD